MDINTEEYSIFHDATSNTVVIKGFLRLDGMQEYKPIMDVLVGALETPDL